MSAERPPDDSFHNPYAFVATPARADGDPTWGRTRPTGHDRWHEGALTGELTLRLTAETPYFSPIAKAGRDEDDRVYKPRRDIPATALKGALRSIYETLTNSCYGVFDPGDKRVSYRVDPGARANGIDATSPRDLAPVRIVRRDGELKAEWMQQVRVLAHGGHEQLSAESPCFPNVKLSAAIEKMGDGDEVWFRHARLGLVVVGSKEHVEKLQDEQRAARFEAFFSHEPNPKERTLFPEPRAIQQGVMETLREPLTIAGVRLPAGTRGVRISSNAGQTFFPFRRDSKGRIRPTKARNVSDGQSVWFAVTSRSVALAVQAAGPGRRPPDGWSTGYLRKHGRTIGMKLYEAIFFSYGTPRYLDLPECVVHDFEQLVEDTQRVSRGQQDDTVESPFLRDPTRRRLSEGTLLYAELHEGAIKKLYMVQVGRALHDATFREVLARTVDPHNPDAENDGPYNRPGSLLPCRHGRWLCPACRLFGWVAQRGVRGLDIDGKPVPTAYRGRLRFSAATLRGLPQSWIQDFTNGSGEEGQGLPLAVLSSPKANRAAFYLRGDGTRSWRKPDFVLAGRKHYWKHPRAETFWRDLPEQADTVQQPHRREGNLVDTQNRVITGWVRPGAQFEARIHFENLSQEELGALLACLELPPGCALRLGGAKPLGLGCFSSRVHDLRLLDVQASYATLDPLAYRQPSTEEVTGWTQAFARTLLRAYAPDGHADQAAAELADIPFVADLFRILAGPVPEGIPIHYPRVTHTDERAGPQIAWSIGHPHHPLPAPRDGRTLRRDQ